MTLDWGAKCWESKSYVICSKVASSGCPRDQEVWHMSSEGCMTYGFIPSGRWLRSYHGHTPPLKTFVLSHLRYTLVQNKFYLWKRQDNAQFPWYIIQHCAVIWPIVAVKRSDNCFLNYFWQITPKSLDWSSSCLVSLEACCDMALFQFPQNADSFYYVVIQHKNVSYTLKKK